MKYLIFGDVHGNLPALENLFSVEAGNYDQAVCHGDVVNYGPWSNECVEFLDSVSDIIVLKGNHEDAFLNGIYPGRNEVAKAFFNFCYPRFRAEDEIEKYGVNYNVGNFTVIHTIDGLYLYPDSELSMLNIEKNYIIGHSHYQFNRKTGIYRIVNTGSVGQNRTFINVAEYLIYDTKKEQVHLKSFKFNIDHLIGKMEEEKYPKICLDYYKNKTKI